MRRRRCKSCRRASRPSGRLIYADRRQRMPLEKPAAVAVDPVESAKWDELTAARAGSSPRARGAAAARALRRGRAGIIPACAGSSYEAFEKRKSELNHPRVFGEQPLGHLTDVLLGIVVQFRVAELVEAPG